MLEDGAIVSDLLREKGQNSARSRFISDESYTHFVAPDKEIMDESEESKEPQHSRINTCSQAFYTAPADQLDIPHFDDKEEPPRGSNQPSNFGGLFLHHNHHYDYSDLTQQHVVSSSPSPPTPPLQQESERMNIDLPKLQDS